MCVLHIIHSIFMNEIPVTAWPSVFWPLPQRLVRAVFYYNKARMQYRHKTMHVFIYWFISLPGILSSAAWSEIDNLGFAAFLCIHLILLLPYGETCFTNPASSASMIKQTYSKPKPLTCQIRLPLGLLPVQLTSHPVLMST